MASWRIRFHDKWPHLASLYASTHNLDEEGKYPDPIMGQDNIFDPSEPYGAYRYYVQPSTRSEFSIEEPGYMHRTVYKDEESRSSDYTSGDSFRRGSTCRVLLCVFLVFSFIGVVVAAITLAVLLSQTPTPVPEKQAHTEMFESTASIFARDFNEKLLDNSTIEFKQLEDEFCEAIEQMFTDSDSPVKNTFGGCEVLEFINGSVQVRYRLKLLSKSPESFKMDEKITQKLQEHFAKKANEIGPWQKLRFNPSFLRKFVRIEPVTTPAPPSSTTTEKMTTTKHLTTETARTEIQKDVSTVSPSPESTTVVSVTTESLETTNVTSEVTLAVSTESPKTVTVTSESPKTETVTSERPQTVNVTSEGSTASNVTSESPETSAKTSDATIAESTPAASVTKKITTEEKLKITTDTEVLVETTTLKSEDILGQTTHPDVTTPEVTSKKRSTDIVSNVSSTATSEASSVKEAVVNVTAAVIVDTTTADNLTQLTTELPAEETTTDIFDFFYYYNDTFETTESSLATSTEGVTTEQITDGPKTAANITTTLAPEVTTSEAPVDISTAAVDREVTLSTAVDITTPQTDREIISSVVPAADISTPISDKEVTSSVAPEKDLTTPQAEKSVTNTQFVPPAGDLSTPTADRNITSPVGPTTDISTPQPDTEVTSSTAPVAGISTIPVDKVTTLSVTSVTDILTTGTEKETTSSVALTREISTLPADIAATSSAAPVADISTPEADREVISSIAPITAISTHQTDIEVTSTVATMANISTPQPEKEVTSPDAATAEVSTPLTVTSSKAPEVDISTPLADIETTTTVVTTTDSGVKDIVTERHTETSDAQTKSVSTDASSAQEIAQSTESVMVTQTVKTPELTTETTARSTKVTIELTTHSPTELSTGNVTMTDEVQTTVEGTTKFPSTQTDASDSTMKIVTEQQPVVITTVVTEDTTEKSIETEKSTVANMSIDGTVIISTEAPTVVKVTTSGEKLTSSSINATVAENVTDEAAVFETVTKNIEGVSEVVLLNDTDVYDYNTSEIYFYETTTSEPWLLNITTEVSSDKVTTQETKTTSSVGTTTHYEPATTRVLVETEQPLARTTETQTIKTLVDETTKSHVINETLLETTSSSVKASTVASATEATEQTTEVNKTDEQSTVIPETTSTADSQETTRSPVEVSTTLHPGVSVTTQDVSTVKEVITVIQTERPITTGDGIIASTQRTEETKTFTSEQPFTTAIGSTGVNVTFTESRTTGTVPSKNLTTDIGSTEILVTATESTTTEISLETLVTEFFVSETTAIERFATETPTALRNATEVIATAAEDSVTEQKPAGPISTEAPQAQQTGTDSTAPDGLTTKAVTVKAPSTGASVTSEGPSQQNQTEADTFVPFTTQSLSETITGLENATAAEVKVNFTGAITSDVSEVTKVIVTTTGASTEKELSTSDTSTVTTQRMTNESTINVTKTDADTTAIIVPEIAITTDQTINGTDTGDVLTTSGTTKSAEKAFLDEYGEAAFIDEYVPTSVNITEETSVISSSNDTQRSMTTKGLPVATTASPLTADNVTGNATQFVTGTTASVRPVDDNVTSVAEGVTKLSGNETTVSETTHVPVDMEFNTTTVQFINATEKVAETTFLPGTTDVTTIIPENLTDLPVTTEIASTEQSITRSSTIQPATNETVDVVISDTILPVDQNETLSNETAENVTVTVMNTTQSATQTEGTVKNQTLTHKTTVKLSSLNDSTTTYYNMSEYFYNTTEFFYEYYNVTTESPSVDIIETTQRVNVTDSVADLTRKVSNETVSNITRTFTNGTDESQNVTETTTLPLEFITDFTTESATELVTEVLP